MNLQTPIKHTQIENNDQLDFAKCKQEENLKMQTEAVCFDLTFASRSCWKQHNLLVIIQKVSPTLLLIDDSQDPLLQLQNSSISSYA